MKKHKEYKDIKYKIRAQYYTFDLRKDSKLKYGIIVHGLNILKIEVSQQSKFHFGMSTFTFQSILNFKV